MRTKAELVQEFVDNIFAGNVEIKNYAQMLNIIAAHNLKNNIKREIERWITLRKQNPLSPDFTKQTDLVYSLIIKGREQRVVHGKFPLPYTDQELRRQIDELTDQRNKLAQDLGILPGQSRQNRDKKTSTPYT
jgi:hypothetical protein